MNFLKRLALVIAFAAGWVGWMGARAEAPAACRPPVEVEKQLAAENAGIQPVKRLEGQAADDLARAHGADFKASHILIYVVGDNVFLVAFVDGCFKGIASVDGVQFRLMHPGVLPEGK